MASVISEEQVRSQLKVNEVIAAIRKAFAGDFRSVRMPVRTQLEMGSSVLLLMPCYDPGVGVAGVKMVTVSAETGVNATYLLLDPATGNTLAVIEANYLTDLRTAATSALATDLLARRDAETLGIFGTGRQAKAHLVVLPHVRPFKRFLVCGSGRSDLASFCRQMKQQHGIEVEPVSAEVCAQQSDVLCTCTTSAEPLFDGKLLRPGTHLNLVGAFQPHTREVDDRTVEHARVVVDTYEGALAEAGDLLIPLRNHTITHEHIIADLHELVSGEKQGRALPQDITLFKSVGCAVEDLVTAKLVYDSVNSKPRHRSH
jgi:ornithine cyclodeaminase